MCVPSPCDTHGKATVSNTHCNPEPTGPVLVRVSIPARSKLGRKGFIQLTLTYCCLSPRKSGLEFKQVRKQELKQRKKLCHTPNNKNTIPRNAFISPV
jgi:hypothetical protein